MFLKYFCISDEEKLAFRLLLFIQILTHSVSNTTRSWTEAPVLRNNGETHQVKDGSSIQNMFNLKSIWFKLINHVWHWATKIWQN